MSPWGTLPQPKNVGPSQEMIPRKKIQISKTVINICVSCAKQHWKIKSGHTIIQLLTRYFSFSWEPPSYSCLVLTKAPPPPHQISKNPPPPSWSLCLWETLMDGKLSYQTPRTFYQTMRPLLEISTIFLQSLGFTGNLFNFVCK